MRVALIADIHGNLPALQAVLADIRRKDVDQIVCLGDVATMGPQPGEVVQVLADLNCQNLMGNHDTALLAPETAADLRIGEPVRSSLAWTVSRLSPSDMAFLSTFRPLAFLFLQQGQLCCFHGTPSQNFVGISPLASDSDLLPVVQETGAMFIGCGHTHVQMRREVSDRVIINPGSVGHVFRTFPGGPNEVSVQPWAEYAIIDSQKKQTIVELLRVDFDTGSVRKAAMATDSPMREWWERQYV